MAASDEYLTASSRCCSSLGDMWLSEDKVCHQTLPCTDMCRCMDKISCVQIQYIAHPFKKAMPLHGENEEGENDEDSEDTYFDYSFINVTLFG